MPGERPPVAVVTGGGGGIGAAVAEELGRRGAVVVTVDPLVSLDGAEQLPPSEETTAGRIVAAGGRARASSASVTDGAAVQALVDELVAEHGGLDAVVNVAGISRPTSFAAGTEEDWTAVLEVHLDGYLNVLRAALPAMAAAGRGRVLGVTSGSGWRAADAGAYGCAKRAVAALTWQLGPLTPPGVAVNAISPIAVTRMVTAALERAGRSGGGGRGRTGGLSLGSMPRPEDLGPLAAHLVDPAAAWCRGQVVFAGGSEVAVVEPPRPLEVVRTDGAGPLDRLLEAATERLLAPAEARQATGGGSNPRLGALPDGPAPAADLSGPCVVVSDRPELAAAVTAALAGRGIAATTVAPHAPPTFDSAAAALAGTGAAAVVVALAGRRPAGAAGAPWQRVLAEHEGLAGDLRADAAWSRAAADLTAAAGRRPLRLVTLTDATTSGGRSRAQAAAQLARAARSATEDRVAAFAVAVEGDDHGTRTVAAALAAHLVGAEAATGLAGAELAVGDGVVALRSHPRPSGSLVLGGPELPPWFDGALRDLVGAPPAEGPT